jgi:long-chain acyl-CoA synthetase
LYDKLIFGKIKAIIGGKVRLMITGTDSISPEILKFLKICFCVDICQLYGLNESSAGACMSFIGDP